MHLAHRHPTAARYWRAPFAHETKLDFAEIEQQESRALGGSSVRMAVILAGVMEKWVAWANQRLTSPVALRDLPAFLGDEFGDEMARVMARAYSDGVRAHERAMERIGLDPVRVGLTRSAERYITEEAARWGLDRARKLTDDVRPILSSAFAPDGRRTKPLELVEREIRSYFGRYFEDGPETDWMLAEPDPDAAEKPKRHRGRRMKVRDAKQHAKWQREFKPYSKWMREEAPKLAQKRVRLAQVSRERWLATERTRYFAHGQIAAAQADPQVVQLAYSALRDGRECDACAERDGVVRPKGDDWWGVNTPPMHPRCRCNVAPIVAAERVRSTPKTDLRRITDDGVADGFGGYNPRRVASAKRLEVSGPATKKMTRAIRDAAGKNKRRRP